MLCALLVMEQKISRCSFRDLLIMNHLFLQPASAEQRPVVELSVWDQEIAESGAVCVVSGSRDKQCSVALRLLRVLHTPHVLYLALHLPCRLFCGLSQEPAS